MSPATVGLRIGSLFAGIGGLELGLEWAGLGHTVWQVEKEATSRAVLAEYWPEAIRFDDVCSVGRSNLLPVELICGGFPCQDISSAGKRAGLAGARSGLWYEFARIVEEMRPRWVVIENVASGASRWVDTVRGDLERIGYASLPVPLSASDCGAPHRRARIFIVAHADGDAKHARAIDAEVASASQPTAHAHGAIVREQQGRSGGTNGGDSSLASVDGWREPIPDMVRVVHGVPKRMDGTVARIRALGNTAVPQNCEVIGHVIRQLIGEAVRS